MTTVLDICVKGDKTFGEGVIRRGVVMLDATRIPTGVFAFDLATGGGFPEGRVSILWGPPSSMKTSFALKAIAMAQRLHPDKKSVLVDIENAYEPGWGSAMGVDNENLVYVRPDYAEQAVDLVEEILNASDVGLVVVDSLAALITANEVKNSADVAVVGGSGLVVGKLYRKATLAIAKAARTYGGKPTLIAINQVRMKIGTMYGNPEVMPGGMAFTYASALTVRLYGKDEMDKKVHGTLPAWKKVSGIVQKFKVPVIARSFEALVATVDNPELGLVTGMSHDWPVVRAYLKLYELMAQTDTKQWLVLGQAFDRQMDIHKRFMEDLDFADGVRKAIVDAAQNSPQVPVADVAPV